MKKEKVRVPWIICVLAACCLQLVQALFIKAQAEVHRKGASPRRLVDVGDGIQLWAVVDFNRLISRQEVNSVASAIFAYNPRPKTVDCNTITEPGICTQYELRGQCKVKPAECRLDLDKMANFKLTPEKEYNLDQGCLKYGIDSIGSCGWSTKLRPPGSFRSVPVEPCKTIKNWKCEGKIVREPNSGALVALYKSPSSPRRAWRNTFFAATYQSAISTLQTGIVLNGCFTIQRTRMYRNAVIDFIPGAGGSFNMQRVFQGDFNGAIEPPPRITTLAQETFGESADLRYALPVRINTGQFPNKFWPLVPSDPSPDNRRSLRAPLAPIPTTGRALWGGQVNPAYNTFGAFNQSNVLDTMDQLLLNSSGTINSAFQPFFDAKRLEKTCSDVYNVSVPHPDWVSGITTCGQLIANLTSWLNMTRHEAEIEVGAFPSLSAPGQCAACNNPNIDDVWNNTAVDAVGPLTCGERIEMYQKNLGLSLIDARKKVARDFYYSCGAVEPDDNFLPRSPEPHVRACARTGCCGCCRFANGGHGSEPIQLDWVTLETCVNSVGPRNDPSYLIAGWDPGMPCKHPVVTPRPTTSMPTKAPTSSPLPTIPPTDGPAPKPVPPKPVPVPGKCGRNYIDIPMIFWHWKIDMCKPIDGIAKSVDMLKIRSVGGCVLAMANYLALCTAQIDKSLGLEATLPAVQFCSATSSPLLAACESAVNNESPFDYEYIMECFDCPMDGPFGPL